MRDGEKEWEKSERESDSENERWDETHGIEEKRERVWQGAGMRRVIKQSKEKKWERAYCEIRLCFMRSDRVVFRKKLVENNL